MRRRLSLAVIAGLLSVLGAACATGYWQVAPDARQAPAASRGWQAARAMVTGIADGDSLTVALDGLPTRVRLIGIDAPESGQAFGRRATQSLREMVAKREVEIAWRDSDRYGRLLATVRVDGADVNAEQVRRGFAWVYRAYSLDPAMLQLEQEARAAKRGLWVDPSPEPPWEWRKRKSANGGRADDLSHGRDTERR